LATNGSAKSEMKSVPSEVESSSSLSHRVSEAPKVEAAQNLHLLSKAIEEDAGAAVPLSGTSTTNASPSKVGRTTSDHPSLAASKSEEEEEADETEEDVISSPPTEGDEKNTNVFTHQYQMTPLPPDFSPGPYDVLCGRGRVCKEAPGNRAYRDAILQQLQVYVAADTKLAKGTIISGIMETIRHNCYQYHGDAVGGFVKCVNGLWYDVGDFLAREKTSQCFRDALAAHYSSSAQSKYLRRRARDDREPPVSRPPYAASPEVRVGVDVPPTVFRGRTIASSKQPSFD
jgi:hypothetical protein